MRSVIALCCGATLWSLACAPQRADSAIASPSAHPERTAPYCAPRAPEVCLDGIDNNCNGLFEEGCGVAQGTIHFFLAWQQPDVDLDLLVIDPSGAPAEGGAISRGGLLKERECPAKGEKECKGGAYENVVLVASREPMPGQYRVEVNADPAPTQPVTVVLAGRLGAQLVWERFVLDATVPVRTFDWSMPSVP